MLIEKYYIVLVCRQNDFLFASKFTSAIRAPRADQIPAAERQIAMREESTSLPGNRSFREKF